MRNLLTKQWWGALWGALHAFYECPKRGIATSVAAITFLGVSFVAAEELNIYFSTTEFCVSCHSMDAYVYKEYQESKHYQTSSGVRPQCGDCHVSKRFFPAVWDHLVGVEDLIGEFSHDWTKPETFAERRFAMADKVRFKMLESDSENCRECHVWEAVKPKRKRGQRAHKSAIEEGLTCIACHYNLVHKEVELSQRLKDAVDSYGKKTKKIKEAADTIKSPSDQRG